MSDRALFSCTENPILPWENDAGSSPFCPQKGAEYILSLSVYSEDGEAAYYSDDTNGFVCPTDLYADSKNDDDNKGNISDGTDSEKDDKKGIPTRLVIVILASGAVVAVSVTAAVCILMRNKKTKKKTDTL